MTIKQTIRAYIDAKAMKGYHPIPISGNALIDYVHAQPGLEKKQCIMRIFRRMKRGHGLLIINTDRNKSLYEVFFVPGGKA